DAATQNPDLPLTNDLLAGAAAAMGDLEEAGYYESRGAAATPADPLFHWMLGIRLQNFGMNQLAERHFQQAMQLDPTFRARRNLDLMNSMPKKSEIPGNK